MSCFADTSFLLSVAGDDAHTPKATAWLATHEGRIYITALVRFECLNRLHKWHLDGTLDYDEHSRALLQLDTLTARRFFIVREVPLRTLAAEARRLIEHFSPGIPHGTLDTLHLAAARALRCDTVLTFDHNQRALALSAGLDTLPM